MSDGQFHKVNEIFNRVCAVAPAQRDALIDELAGENPAVAAKVRALLKIDDSVPPFMDGDGMAAKAAARIAEAVPRVDHAQPPPEQIGRYKILSQLGEGGMGVVYRARQTEPMQRDVALKLIRPGMDSEQVIGRFKAERQALARLDHPGIAHVYDGGVTEIEQGARPYFVMELCDGETITTYCDAQTLGIADRLQLFLRVCDAVHHAHQRGIIHRDLKPSNVLVVRTDDSIGQPKVIDFGVAKAICDDFAGDTMYSVAGQLVGTPEYMSPEQADLSSHDIDTRSDIYALGVLLYELLSGHLPFERDRLRSAGLSGAQRIICDEQPRPPSLRVRHAEAEVDRVATQRNMTPSSLARELTGDLDWIVMKCLEKERDRRYDSASALAEDVRRHLRFEPVEAGPPSVTYRLRKFARRHRAAAIAISFAIVSVIGGLGGVSWGWIAALRSESDIRAARDTAQQRADELQVVTDFQQTLLRDTDVDRMGANIVSEVRALLDSTLTDQNTADRQERLNQLDRLLRKINHADLARSVLDQNILARAAETIDDQFADEPGIAAALMFSIGRTYQELGLPAPAEARLLRSLEIARAELGADSLVAIQSMSHLSYLYLGLGRVEEADEMASAALETAERVLGPEHLETLHAGFNRALVDEASDRVESGEARHRELIETMTAVLGAEHDLTLITKNQYAVFLLGQSRYEESLPLCRELMEIRRRLSGEDSKSTLAATSNLSVALTSLGQLEEAEPIVRLLLTQYSRQMGDEHWMTVNAKNTYVYLLLQLDRPAEALPFARSAAEFARDFHGPEHTRTLTYLGNYGAALQASGEPEAAVLVFRNVYESRQRASGEEAKDTLWARYLLADCLSHTGDADESLALFDRCIAQFKSTSAPEDPDNAFYPLERSAAQVRLGNLDDADHELALVIALAEKIVPEEHRYWSRIEEIKALLADARARP